MSTTPQLRPLGIGEVLDVAIKAYTTNARTLITIGAIIGVPFALLSGVIELSTVTSADQVSGSFRSLGNTMPATDYSRARLAGLGVTLVIMFVVGLLLTAATVKAVSDAYLGDVPSVRDSLLFAMRRIRSLIWLYVVLGVGLFLAVLALFIPAIWLYVAWSVATPALLLEDVRGTAALRRSFRLVRHRWWPTAAVQLMAAVIVGITSSVVQGLLAAIPALINSSSLILAVVATAIASAFTFALGEPLRGAITTILYFDLRVRKEGFDLSLLAGRLGLPDPGARPAAGGLAPRAGAPVDADGRPPPFWPPPPGWTAAGSAAPAEPTGSAPPYWPPPPGWRPPEARPDPRSEG